MGLAEQEALARTLARTREGLNPRELRTELVAAGGFLLIAFSLVIIEPPQTFPAGEFLLSVALLAPASLVRFDTPFGFLHRARRSEAGRGGRCPQQCIDGLMPPAGLGWLAAAVSPGVRLATRP